MQSGGVAWHGRRARRPDGCRRVSTLDCFGVNFGIYGERLSSVGDVVAWLMGLLLLLYFSQA